MANEVGSLPNKRCFVTIGATAPFDKLIKAVFETPFLHALHEADYTELRIQYGKEGQAVYDDLTKKYGNDIKSQLSIEVTGFAFDKSGLEKEMKAAKGNAPMVAGHVDPSEGTIISHAGSGSILDALRFEVPMIVVPNTDLLHNHQVELAEELAKQKYVVYGKLNNLAEAIPEIEDLRTQMQQWPSVRSGEDKYQRGLAGVMDEEMGWVD